MTRKDRSAQTIEAGEFMTKGEQTRRKIVEAAAPIFNKRGYDGSSLNDGIYRHFLSKEELAAEAFDYTWEAAGSVHLLYLDEKANGIEKLRQLITNFIDHRSPWLVGCPILDTAIDADDGNPVLRAHVAKALRSRLSRLRRNEEALRRVQSHLNQYLENEVAAAQ